MPLRSYDSRKPGGIPVVLEDFHCQVAIGYRVYVDGRPRGVNQHIAYAASHGPGQGFQCAFQGQATEQ